MEEASEWCITTFSQRGIEVAATGHGFILLTVPPRLTDLTSVLDELRAEFQCDVDVENSPSGLQLRVWLSQKSASASDSGKTKTALKPTVFDIRLAFFSLLFLGGSWFIGLESVRNQLEEWGYA